MKIVIDIPDAIMEYVRNNGCLSVIYDDEVAKAIINGTPYEDRPQGDLISRAWLKKHKFTTQVCNGLEIEDDDVVGVAIIDNAPTVVAKNATSDRPQGDLISREALIKAVEQGEGISWERHKKDDLCVRKKYIDNAPTVEYPEQIIIKCDTEEDKQKLLSALRNARLTICEEADND